MFKITYFKQSFLKKINWKKLVETPLKRAGLLVRRIARNSIKPVSYPSWNSKLGVYQIRNRSGYSKPGGAPWSRSPGHPMKRIYSLPEKLLGKVNIHTITGSASYIVGTDISDSKKRRAVPVPGLHEHGGRVTRQIPTKGGGRRTVSARYPKRPFMGPALEKAEPKIKNMWKV